MAKIWTKFSTEILHIPLCTYRYALFRLREQSGHTVQLLDSVKGVLSNEEFLNLRYCT